MNDINDRETSKIAPTAHIYPNVHIGRNVTIDHFCLIGYPPKGHAAGELETTIGDDTVIRSHTVIYAGCRIGCRCHIAHGVFMREFIRLGNDSSIGMDVVIEHHCDIGDRVRVQGQAGLAEHTIVEEDAWIGPRVITANVLHPTCKRAKDCLAGPIIRRHAIIGAQAFISPDIEVGEHALVSACSMVTKSVEDRAIVFGVPARKIGTVDAVKCPYDLMEGRSPYSPTKDDTKIDRIPLTDLAIQHQQHKQEIRRAIDRVILNARFIMGKEVGEFEEAFADFSGVQYAVGVSSGTDAIALSLKALKIGAGDEVIAPAHTFIATASAIIAAGARPVLVEIEDRTYCLDPADVEAKITERTKAIIPVHMNGHPADMEAICEIARKNGLHIIEDAAQSNGASANGTRVGQWGTTACFSFFPSKNLGAYGDAGAVVTNDSRLAERIRMLRSHGRSDKFTSHIVGGNHRLDTIQAAVLNVKLKYLDDWNGARAKIAAFYADQLGDLPLVLPAVRDGCTHVYYLYAVRTRERDAMRRHLAERGVATGVHYHVPLHLQPALAELGYRAGDFPTSEAVTQEILSLPMYPELSEDRATIVVQAVREFWETQ